MRRAVAICVGLVFLSCGGGGGAGLPEELCDSCIRKAMEEKSCIITACNCTNDNSLVNVSKIKKTIKTPPPKMLCREDQMMTLAPAEFSEGTTYYLEYKHKEKNYSLSYTNLTICRNLEMFDLEPNSSYSIRAFGINLNTKVFTRSLLTTKKTLPRNFNPTPVDTLFQRLDAQEDSYSAVVRWSYHNDSDRPCCFNIVLFDYTDGQHFQDELREPVENYTIRNLQFERKYFFAIMGATRNRLRESARKNITISIPSCVETFENLEKCVPDTPTNLHVNEILIDANEDGVNPIYDVVLNWSVPKLDPYYYSISIITYHNDRIRSMNVSGNTTEAAFPSVELDLKYAVQVVAWSPRGPSEPALVHREFDNRNVLVVPREQLVSYRHVLVVSVATVGAVVSLIVAACVYRRCCAKRAADERHVEFVKDIKSASLNNMIQELIIQHENDEWEIKEEQLTISSDLGKGAFGIVHKGLYKHNGNSIEIAIKMLKDAPTKDQITQFYDEIEIMKSVPKHPHLVSLIGIVTKGRESNPMMVVEYCAKGDLQLFLKNTWEILITTTQNIDYINNINFYKTYANTNVFSNKIYDVDISHDSLPIHPKELISMARQIALGMEFLSSIKVLHRDLAARNVLVCADNTIKISDFGLSRDVYKDNVYLKTGGGKLPFRWMALESMTHQRYTTQSDVWSFGILLWEIVTLGSSPYPGINTQDLLPLLKSGYRMEKPQNCSDELYSIMTSCWKANPQDRPSFSDLVKDFEKLLENETPYLSLNINPSIDKIGESGYAKGNVMFPTLQADRYLLPVAVKNNKYEKA